MDVPVLALSVVTVLLLGIVIILVLRLRTRLPAAPGAATSQIDLRAELSAQRLELRENVASAQSAIDQRVSGFAQTQSAEFAREQTARRQESADLQKGVTAGLSGIVDQLHAQARTTSAAHADFRTVVDTRLDAIRDTTDDKLERIRATVDEKLQGTLATALQDNAEKIQALNAANSAKHIEMQTLLREELEKLRTGNEAKLEKMRETVDEKLQGTLEKRLGESFALVSERLEQVQKGLGEMQTLASDVGGLKRVLTNVKNRGSWGEVQLSRQLDDILTPGQYEQNVVIKTGTQESVEFAVRLPGRDQDAAVYLPIDSKFPQEDYERLLEAQEQADKSEVDAAGRALERAVVAQAKLIASKYIDPPRSTDFAIMYLPTEGLFAEVVRRPGLASRLQSEHRILVTGPTTLMSLLNSLQMGFRTLAIEQRSSEVWQVLSAAKSEFQKYGQVWDKLEKQLKTAQRTVQEAGTRTRAVERRLRNVEVMEVEGASEIMSDVLDAALEGDNQLEQDYALGAELDDVRARIEDSAES